MTTEKQKAWRRAYQSRPEFKEARKKHLAERMKDPEYRVNHLAKKRAWWHRNKYGSARVTRLKSTYGASVEEIDQMHINQGGACAICKEPMKRVCIDHAHGTGKIRALLCSDCNVALGLFKDLPERLLLAHAYLLKHQS